MYNSNEYIHTRYFPSTTQIMDINSLYHLIYNLKGMYVFVAFENGTKYKAMLKFDEKSLHRTVAANKEFKDEELVNTA